MDPAVHHRLPFFSLNPVPTRVFWIFCAAVVNSIETKLFNCRNGTRRRRINKKNLLTRINNTILFIQFFYVKEISVATLLWIGSRLISFLLATWWIWNSFGACTSITISESINSFLHWPPFRVRTVDPHHISLVSWCLIGFSASARKWMHNFFFIARRFNKKLLVCCRRDARLKDWHR